MSIQSFGIAIAVIVTSLFQLVLDILGTVFMFVMLSFESLFLRRISHIPYILMWRLASIWFRFVSNLQKSDNWETRLAQWANTNSPFFDRMEKEVKWYTDYSHIQE